LWVIGRLLSVGAVAAGLLVAAGCSGGTSHSEEFRALPPPARTQAELAGALLRAEDLPAGYTLQPTAPNPPPGAEASPGASPGEGQGGGADDCADVFEQLRGGQPALSRVAASAAQVEFGKGDYGPFLQQSLLSTGDQKVMRAAIDAFRRLPTTCGQFTETDEAGSFTVKVSEASLPALGDESIAVKLDANGRSTELDVTMSGFMVLVRKGSVVCIVIHFGIPGVDAAETEKIARAAAARLG
jgi:hypothetical protein